MEQVGNFQILKEYQKLNENISLWFAESQEGLYFEVLIIKKKAEYQTLLDRILRSEIQPILNASIEGFQKTLQFDLDTEQQVYYIVYEPLGGELVPLSNISLLNFKNIVLGIDALKKQNRFCHIFSPAYLLSTNKHLKLRFLGLFELFKQQGLLEAKYLAPEITEWLNDTKKSRPNFQADIYSLFKTFESFVVKTNHPKLNQVFNQATVEKRTERYVRYREIIDDLEQIKLPSLASKAKPTVLVNTHRGDEDKLIPILEDLSNGCHILYDPNSDIDSIEASFSTKNYSGKFTIDDRNYIFIKYSSCRKTSNQGVLSDGFFVDLNFDFEAIHFFDSLSFFRSKWRDQNSLAKFHQQKRNLLKEWHTLPAMEMEFVEETAFKASYIKREQSKSTPTNIIFTLDDKFRSWSKFVELKQNKVELSLNDKIIGQINDYKMKESVLIIKDSKLTLDEIPEIGELIQDIRKEIGQFKKQVEAVKKFEKRDIVNPDLSSILASPERVPESKQSIFQSDYDNFKEIVINPKLKSDDSQREAVYNALRHKPLYLIQGPPGTGKTTVIVELIQQIIKDKPTAKILVTSQSNLAVDNVLEQLPENVLFMRLAAKEERITNEKIKRHSFTNKLKHWVQETQERSSDNFNSKFKEASRDKALIEFYNSYSNLNRNEDFKNFTNHLRMRSQHIKGMFEKAKSFKDADKIFETKLGSKYQRLKLIQKEWFAFLANAESEDGDKKKSMMNDGSAEIDLQTAFLKSVNVIGATCIHIASGQYNKINFKFDYVIMDESSKASPAETLVPVNMGQNIILIGDHKQLPPVITREEAVRQKVRTELEDNGLDIEKTFGESLFEKLIIAFEHNPQLQNNVKMLDIQYRMPKQIGNIISKFFYQGKLRNPDIKVLPSYDQDKSHELNFKIPTVSIVESVSNSEVKVPASVVFVSTSLKENPSDNNNLSDRRNECNKTTIEEVLTELDLLYKDNHKKKKPFTVGIIAGYRGQVNLLKDKINLAKYKSFEIINKEGRAESLIEINTVDKFQGAERDIIIYDVVKSSKGPTNIGFLDDYRRINVALSRVKRLLIIVGDSEYIMKRASLNKDSQFKEFKLREITMELERQGVIVNNFRDIIL
ncbi:MAG: AAA family ATPase [Bacteroidia bacterium]|nr:AAA family ATPase [Bacteroidia bacterium]